MATNHLKAEKELIEKFLTSICKELQEIKANASVMKTSCLMGPFLLPNQPKEAEFIKSIVSAINGEHYVGIPPYCFMYGMISFCMNLRKASTGLTTHIPLWLMDDSAVTDFKKDPITALRDLGAIKYRSACKWDGIDPDSPDARFHKPSFEVSDKDLFKHVVRQVSKNELGYPEVQAISLYATECVTRAIDSANIIASALNHVYEDRLTIF